MKAREHLQKLQELLKVEKEEDLRLYQESVLKRSLKERVNKGISWYPVQMVRMYIGMGEKLHLEIENPKTKLPDHSFQPGGIVSIFGMLQDKENGRVNGVIARVRQNQMRIALSVEQIPDWLHHSKLGIDLAFDDKTYREMERAMALTIDPQRDDRIGELRELLLGPAKLSFGEWDYVYRNGNLNPSQNRAVQKVLEAKDLAIIHGPPGTGKTTTLVAAIQEVAKREHQILVCAPSNTAVDLLTLRCHEAGLEVVRLGNPVRVEAHLQDLTLDACITQHQDYTALRKLRKDAEKLKKQALKFRRQFGTKERQKRQEMLKEAREVRDLAHKLEDYILFQVLQSAQVITTTLTGANQKVLQGRKFHTVFIDEAAQALTPAALIPMQNVQRVIMAGDHCQLPPTVKSMEAGRGGLGKTLFEWAIEQKPEASVMLNQQYRMHEQIMGFSAGEFYDGELQADPAVRFHRLGPNFAPLSFIDTAGCGFDEQQNPRSLSTANPEEASLLLRHLALLFNQIEAEDPKILENPLKVGIISPYKAQVNTLNTQLLNSPMLSTYLPYISIKTVDGFQGQEKDVIYISLTRSNAKSEIGFLRDIRRMNVALTRARKMLVVVGDSATLGKHPFYERFLQYVEAQDAYHSAWEFL
jgi:ATP-dependent RNA/DNA helicase IGHMBP2